MKLVYPNVFDPNPGYGYNYGYNYATGATISSDLTADTGYPLTNLQNALRTKIWQVTTPSNAAHYIKMDFGSATTVNMISLLNCNFLSGYSLAIQGNATDAWGSPSVNVSLDGVGIAANGLDSYVYFTGGSYRWWRLAFTISGSPTVINLGRIFMGNPTTPATTFKVGYKDAKTAIGAVNVSLGGQEFVDQRNQPRMFDLAFTGISNTEKFSTWEPFFLNVGINHNFVLTLDSSDAANTSIYGRIPALPQWGHEIKTATVNTHGLTFQVKEAV